ncbi:MAG: YhgE/Pip domain-containing protein [Solirubrobacteraceae bacterium]
MWIPPITLVAILIVVMTLVYFGSVVNPTGHLRGLPVGIVNQDAGASVGGQRVDLGRQLAVGLISSPAVSSRLALHPSTLAAAKGQMEVGKEYAAVVLPPGFTVSLLAVAGIGRSSSKPTVELLTNPRAGTLAVSLATGVLAPALSHASGEIGEKLLGLSSAHRVTRAATGVLADPITVATVPYLPLPSHSALGLSAFYISLLTTFCGFLGAVIVNTSIDAALGYASTEIGPVWRQRQPVTISRWQTLVAKWVMAVGLTVILTGLMLFTAVVILKMNTTHFALLWLLSWFAATVIAIGTLVLFAALGTLGQLVALVVFVYLALASSGGTVPLDALSGFFRFVANFEPLRQILDGVRAILYFDARGAAGLTRAWIATGIGLVFWVALGILVTTWYDRRRLYRMPPDLMEYVDRAVLAYQTEKNETGTVRRDPDHGSASTGDDARDEPAP